MLPVPGKQKPPPRVGKRFQDRFEAAPGKKVKKPAGLQMRPTWLRQDRQGVNPEVCCSDTGLSGMASAAMQALRPLTAMTLPRDPTQMVKEWGPRLSGHRRAGEEAE